MKHQQITLKLLHLQTLKNCPIYPYPTRQSCKSFSRRWETLSLCLPDCSARSILTVILYVLKETTMFTISSSYLSFRLLSKGWLFPPASLPMSATRLFLGLRWVCIFSLILHFGSIVYFELNFVFFAQFCILSSVVYFVFYIFVCTMTTNSSLSA